VRTINLTQSHNLSQSHKVTRIREGGIGYSGSAKYSDKCPIANAARYRFAVTYVLMAINWVAGAQGVFPSDKQSATGSSRKDDDDGESVQQDFVQPRFSNL
jgi:hypothetical protein